MPKRIAELDGLRAFAVIAVFLEHAIHLRMMWIGVDLFFVLSGFLITGILLDMQHNHFGQYLAAFYERRLRRLWPAYCITLILISVFYGWQWLHHWYMYFGLMNYLAFFPNGMPNVAITPFWSLAVEEQFYLFWPLLIFFLPAARLPKVLIGILVVAPVLRGLATPWCVHHGYPWLIYTGTIFRADTLAAGGLLTFIWRAHREKVRAYGHYGLVLAALVPLVMITLSHFAHGFGVLDGTVHGNVVTFEVALVGMFGLVLWGLSGRYTSILTLRPLRWLATISYMFYLVHRGALDVVHRYVPQTILGGLIAGAVSLAIAQASWMLVERPILQGGSRRRRERELAAATATELQIG